MKIKLMAILSKEDLALMGKFPSISNVSEYVCQQVLEFGDGAMGVDPDDGSVDLELWHCQGEENE